MYLNNRKRELISWQFSVTYINSNRSSWIFSQNTQYFIIYVISGKVNIRGTSGQRDQKNTWLLAFASL